MDIDELGVGGTTKTKRKHKKPTNYEAEKRRKVNRKSRRKLRCLDKQMAKQL